MKNYIFRALAAAAALVLLICGCSRTEPTPELPEEITLYYFHDTVCGSCDGAERFYDLASQELAGVRERYPYRIVVANVYETEGRDLYGQVTDELGLDRDSLSLPLMIAGGKVYSGLDTIGDNLQEAYLVAGEDLFDRGMVYNPKIKNTGDTLFENFAPDPKKATLLYFYRITCEECGQTAPVIDALPAAVTVDGRKVEVEILRINTRSGNNGERITALFEAYQVPQEDQKVPIVFLAQGYLAGYDAIFSEAVSRLEAGDGMGFAFP